MASRFFVTPGSVREGVAEITGPDVHHISHVLRLDIGADVEIVDPKSGTFLANLTGITEERISVRVIRKLAGPTGAGRLVLFQGLPKGAKMDGIVRGAVEVGVDKIVPVYTERSVLELTEEKALKRAERWRRIAVEASKQSKRDHVTEVADPVELSRALQIFTDFDAVLIFWEEERVVFPFDVLQSGVDVDRVAVVVGPEGGLTGAEVASLEMLGGVAVTMGESVLRTQTAGVVAPAIVKYELERKSKIENS